MKILLIRFSALGDAVLTTGIIAYIKKNRPDVTIDFATSQELLPAFQDNPYIDQLITIPKKAPVSQYLELAKTLEPYQHIFDLHGTLKAKAFAKKLTGQVHEINKQSLQRRLFVRFRWCKNKLSKHVVEKYADTCLPVLGLHTYTLEDIRPHFKTSVEDKNIKSHFHLPDRYVVLHPYASQRNKVWPYFTELCDKLHEFNIPVVVIGQGDQSWPEHVRDLTNHTDVVAMKKVISQANAVVTTDSGPMHMAIAYYRPTIAIFGPTTKELGFMPPFKNTFVFENQTLACRPCHIHGGNHCPRKHFKCMKSIPMPTVFSKVCEFF